MIAQQTFLLTLLSVLLTVSLCFSFLCVGERGGLSFRRFAAAELADKGTEKEERLAIEAFVQSVNLLTSFFAFRLCRCCFLLYFHFFISGVVFFCYWLASNTTIFLQENKKKKERKQKVQLFLW